MPAPSGETFEVVATGRGRVRVLLLALVLVGAAFFLALRTDDDEGLPEAAVPATSNAAELSGLESAAILVERAHVVGGAGGITEIRIDFDRALPSSEIRYVEDVSLADPDVGLAFTTQEATSVQVCDSVHSFPPPSQGTVDLLIPSAWFAHDDESFPSALEESLHPSKFVLCGPHRGFYQYSIWGPVSADVDDVNMIVSSGGTRLTIQIDTPPLPATKPPATRDEACAAGNASLDMMEGLVDARARSLPEQSVWALFFVTERPAFGGPLTVEVGTELKIAWQASGDGDVALVAVGPDAGEIAPTSGPNVHGASSWDRVPGGDEWGTGWVIPQEGCWRFELSRANVVVATLDVLAAS